MAEDVAAVTAADELVPAVPATAAERAAGGAPPPDTHVEALAALAHDQWAGWMRYLFARCPGNGDGSVTVPPELVARWRRQTEAGYAELPEAERESDRVEARRVLALLAGRGVLVEGPAVPPGPRP